jgi:hypothetical protein
MCNLKQISNDHHPLAKTIMDYACHFFAFTQLKVNEQLLNGHLKSHRRLFAKE